MRLHLFALAILLAAVPSAIAQTPPSPGAAVSPVTASEVVRSGTNATSDAANAGLKRDGKAEAAPKTDQEKDDKAAKAGEGHPATAPR